MFCNNTFKEINNNNCLSYCLKQLSHPAVFTSNVQFVRLAARLRTLKMCCCKSRLVFNCCFGDTNMLQGSVATHITCGGIFSHSIITNYVLILIGK